jgi:hypothetical protein
MSENEPLLIKSTEPHCAGKASAMRTMADNPKTVAWRKRGINLDNLLSEHSGAPNNVVSLPALSSI